MADYSITAVDRRVVYSGSAGTGPYAFTFPVLATTDIAVYKDSTKLTEGSGSTQYTVALNASNGTGSVTLGAAATSDHTITITGARTIERTTDFVTAGDLLASSLNTELDSQTIFVQQASEDSARAIKAPVYDPTSIDMTLPAKADRLGKLLGFDSSTGNPEATTGRVNTVSVSAVSAGGTPTVSYNDTTGALALGVVTGNTGSTGSTGSSGAAGSDGTDGVGGLLYTFSTTTSDSDPGAGQIRLNNGTLGSVSQIFIDDSTAASGNPDVSAFILTWDDSTQTSDRGQVTIVKKAAQQNFATYKISGASTDASGYVKLAVTHVVSSGSFSNSDAVLVSFARTGNAGSLDDPMTTRGDIIIRNSSNATARLSVGSANTVLKSDGNDPSWGYTVGTSANNLVQLNGSAQLPAVSGANLTNLPVTDVSSDVRFLALQVASDRIGLEDGISDPFTDQTDVEIDLITAGSNGGDMTAAGGLAAGVDGTTAHAHAASAKGANDTGTSFIGKDHGSGVTKTITKYELFAPSDSGFDGDSGGSTITVSLRGSNSTPSIGGGTQLHTDNFSDSTGLTKSYTSGITTSTAYRYHWVEVSTNTTNTGQKHGRLAELKLYATGLSTNQEFDSTGTFYAPSSGTNMTLVSKSFTADSAPSNAIVGVQVVENESITINTDLTAEVSRNGGSNFTSCTLALNTTLGATSTKYYESASTDISSQPSGTSMVYRIKTLNTKDIEVHGVALKWS